MPTTTTIRPGILVSLRTSLRGNMKYSTTDLEADHLTSEGERKARWETERTIKDPDEHERAVKARSKARSVVASVCAKSDFGLLCLQANRNDLDQVIAEAQAIADDFNESATVTRLSFNVICGMVAPDDALAIRAINTEMRQLMEDMQRGLGNLDVQGVRDAANRARDVGRMLAPDMQERVQKAIDAARSAARRIVKAGEQAALEIDQATIARITEARTAFLDFEEQGEIGAPIEDSGRALDLDPDGGPTTTETAPAEQARMFEL